MKKSCKAAPLAFTPWFMGEDMERYLIASLIGYADRVMPICQEVGLCPTDFVQPHHGAIYQACQELHGAGRWIDLVVLASQPALAGPLAAHGGAGYLAELPAISDRGFVRDHAARLKVASLRRQRGRVAGEIARLEASGESTRELIGQLQVLDRQSRELEGQRSISALQFVDLFEEQVPATMPSSLEDLNLALGGGYQTHSYSLLCGGTKHGKSSLALQEARHLAAMGYPVLVVSVEARRREILARLAAQKGGAAWREIWLQWFCPGQGHRLAQALAELGSLSILEYRPGMQIQAILGEVRRLSDATGKPCFVVLDYLQRLLSRAPGATAVDPRQAQAQVSDLLAEASRSQGCHFLVLSSISRPFYSERAGERSDDEIVGAAKEGGGVEYDAGLVLVLRKGRPMPLPDRRSRASLRIAAQRFSGGGQTSFKLIFDGGHNLFVPDQSADEEDPLPKSILALLKQPRHRTGLTVGSIKQAVDGRDAQIIVAVREMAEAGELWCSGKPGAPRVVYRHPDYAPAPAPAPAQEELVK